MSFSKYAGAQMKKIIYGVILLLVILFSLAFAAKNPQIVEIEYYFGIHWKGSLAILLLMAMSVGVLIGALGMFVTALKSRRQANKARKYVVRIEKELENLRALPLKNEA
jgi:putative membrane protein